MWWCAYHQLEAVFSGWELAQVMSGMGSAITLARYWLLEDITNLRICSIMDLYLWPC